MTYSICSKSFGRGPWSWPVSFSCPNTAGSPQTLRNKGFLFQSASKIAARTTARTLSSCKGPCHGQTRARHEKHFKNKTTIHAEAAEPNRKIMVFLQKKGFFPQKMRFSCREMPFSEPPIWGWQKGVVPICSDFFRFAFLVCGNTPICSDLFRFAPISSNLFREPIRTDQGISNPFLPTPF